MSKKLYTVSHYHKFGINHYLVSSSTLPSEDEVVKLLEIDFEPGDNHDDPEEYLEISPCGENEPYDLDELRKNPNPPIG